MRLSRIGHGYYLGKDDPKVRHEQEARLHRWNCIFDEVKSWEKDYYKITGKLVRVIGFMDNQIQNPIVETFIDGKWQEIPRERIFIGSVWANSANHFHQGLIADCPEFDLLIEEEKENLSQGMQGLLDDEIYEMVRKWAEFTESLEGKDYFLSEKESTELATKKLQAMRQVIPAVTKIIKNR